MPNRNILNHVTTMPGTFKRVWYDGRVDNLTKVARYITKSHKTSVTPNWSTVSKLKGALYLNDLEWKYETLDACSGTLQIYDPAKLLSTSSGVFDGFPGGHGAYASVDTAAVGRQALSRAYVNIKNQKVNLSVVFAERKKTADTVMAVARRMYHAVHAVKRGDVTAVERALGVAVTKRAKKALRDPDRESSKGMARAILELQYGIKPLLQDVYGAAEALADTYNTRRTVVRSSATERGTSVSTDTNGQMNRVSNSTCEFTAKYCCYLAPSDAGSQTLTSLGITNPAEVAWELTPWSFVIDWFIPIGNWISTWDALVGVTVVAHTYTEVTVADISTTNTGTGVFSGGYKVTGSTSGKGKLKRIVMTHGSNLPNVGFPSFKDPFSYTHVLNGLALMRSLAR